MQLVGNPNGNRLQIYNNTISSNFYGIGFDGNDGGNANNISIYNNDISAANSAIRFGMLSYIGNDSDIDIYCNKITNTGSSGYPFFFAGTLRNILISNNIINNINSNGFEVYSRNNYSSGVLFCGSSSINVTGGGSVGSSIGNCSKGSVGCYGSAGSRENGPYGSGRTGPNILSVPRNLRLGK